MFCLFLKRKERESKSSQRWFCHSSGAGDTRGRPTQTPHGCARRHRRRQTHRRGSPALGTAAAGWEAQETPGSPRNPSGTWSPPAAPIRSRPRSSDDCESPGLSKIPGGEVTSLWGDAIRPGAHRHSVYPDSAPWCCSASGVRDPRREAVRGAAAQGRGAKAAAIASHVRRLKLYPEPQTWGGRGYRAGWEALSFRPAPSTHRPMTSQRRAHRITPSLNRPGAGRVLKEPRLPEGWTVGIWENPLPLPQKESFRARRS